MLALVAIAGFGGLRRSDPPTSSLAEREALSAALGNRLFLPALIVPLTAVETDRKRIHMPDVVPLVELRRREA